MREEARSCPLLHTAARKADRLLPLPRGGLGIHCSDTKFENKKTSTLFSYGNTGALCLSLARLTDISIIIIIIFLLEQAKSKNNNNNPVRGEGE